MFPIKQVSDTFKKRDIVIRTQGEYPQEICVELHKDRVDDVKETEVGRVVNLSIDIRGREWKGNDKWFNSIVAYKVALVSPSVENPLTPPF